MFVISLRVPPPYQFQLLPLISWSCVSSAGQRPSFRLQWPSSPSSTHPSMATDELSIAPLFFVFVSPSLFITKCFSELGKITPLIPYSYSSFSFFIVPLSVSFIHPLNPLYPPPSLVLSFPWLSYLTYFFLAVASCSIKTAVSSKEKKKGCREKRGRATGRAGQTNNFGRIIWLFSILITVRNCQAPLSCLYNSLRKLDRPFPPEISFRLYDFTSSKVIRSHHVKPHILCFWEIQSFDEWVLSQNRVFWVRIGKEKMHVYTLASPLLSVYFHPLQK